MQCAWAAVKKKNSYLQAQFYRIKARRGPKKAIMAIGKFVRRAGDVFTVVAQHQVAFLAENQLFGDLIGLIGVGLIVLENEFDGVILAANLEAVLDRSLDALEHPRCGSTEVGARPGHAADIADLERRRVGSRDVDDRESARRQTSGAAQA